jgi:hypothetical protein
MSQSDRPKVPRIKLQLELLQTVVVNNPELDSAHDPQIHRTTLVYKSA